MARLARPDFAKASGDLTTKVTKWSKNDDKRMYRLFCHISSTNDKAMLGYVGDDSREFWLQLYTDADFAGDSGSSWSSSVGFLVVRGSHTFFPIAWLCKQQTATSRSTTEAKMISMAAALFSKGFPTLQLIEESLG